MLNRDLFVSKDLPMPLNQEEIIKLIKEYRNGNIDAREKIINHNIRLVIKLVEKHFNCYYYDQQELISTGIIGLINAVDFFDVDKNIAFSTYASKAIIREIVKEIERNNKRIDAKSIEDSVSSDFDEIKIKDTLIDKKANLLEKIETDEMLKDIYNYICKLPIKKKEIMELYFFNENMYTQRDIADMYGLSNSYVSLIIITELKKIRNHLKAKRFIEPSIKIEAKTKRKTSKNLDNVSKKII
ncbi:MAG: sigma-70 family RNA polymerase sigma factor [Bacilli bacterium]|nr:sigma-70 family RNA polymerase sigma factor [Bacilli bacterium]